MHERPGARAPAPWQAARASAWAGSARALAHGQAARARALAHGQAARARALAHGQPARARALAHGQAARARVLARGQPARALAHGQAARARAHQRPGRQRARARTRALAGMRARAHPRPGRHRARARTRALAGMRARAHPRPGRQRARAHPRPCARASVHHCVSICLHAIGIVGCGWPVGVDSSKRDGVVRTVLPTFSSYSLFDGIYYSDNRSNSRANTCNKPRLLEGMHLLDKRSTQALPVALMIHDNSSDRTAFVPATHHSNFCPINFRCWTLGWVDRSASGVHRLARPFCRRCAPGLNWPGRASGAVTLKKLECSKQAYALDTLAWDNTTGF
ncbi:hypothetical protein VNO78_36829 [Psophocarpus tetragonolobus]|uniref:Uncharacterized protein n=1 Tax=Psophocarpus tetragonolobus TaxID=3891 RepID=A0AAN9NEU0_PSOTE